MSRPLQAAPTRRTHAERTARTRARILAAVVESLAEVGFQRTTSAEIARRSGVTWGAVQHHFGGKDGILLAVLEESFRRFAERLTRPPLGDADAPLAARVSRFVDRAWQHFGSREYRSAVEILRNESTTAWQQQLLEAWNGIWREYFPDSRLSRRRTVTLQHYTVAVLSGLAGTRLIEGRADRSPDAELALLKQTLVHELSGPAAS